jgi:hypothetical protein
MWKPPSFQGSKVPQQVPRLVIAIAAAVIALVVARSILVPDTFGELGHYRAAAIDAVVAREKSFAGQQECAMCHFPIMQARLEGNHRGVSCESCHGPAAAHVANPAETKPTIPDVREFCPRCHSYNMSRPTGFAQIDPVAHNPRVPCMQCHDPHAPVPPVTPEECSACHGQIASQKAVSHHAGLECTTCHVATDEHKMLPHRVRPSKPEDRSFCGGCHAEDSSSPGYIPRINLRMHNPRYLCWQCHYPHFPETS